MLNLLMGCGKTGKDHGAVPGHGENRKSRPQVLLVPEQYSHEADAACARPWGTVRRPGRRCSPSPGSGTGADPDRRPGGAGAGPRRPAVADAQAVRAPVQPADPLRKALPEGSLLEHLIATSDELKSYCVSPEELAAAGGEEDSQDGQRLRELGADSGLLRRADGPAGGGPRPADQAGGQAEGL